MPFDLPASFDEHCLLAYCPWGQKGPVHPAEEALCAPWRSAKRQGEFLSGRSAAHRALTALGFPFLPIGRGPRGEPLWPPGAVATLAHDDQGAACLAARRQAPILTLGLDFEPQARPVNPGVYASVFTPAEQTRLQGPEQHKAAFCAKEAVFKACYPLAKVALRFCDAEVSLRAHGRFVAQLQRSPWPNEPAFPQRLEGVWGAEKGRIWAALGLIRTQAGYSFL